MFRNEYQMRWNCDRGGAGRNCFNRKCRIKFAAFSDCFPRKINFSDVDGIAEMGGAFCLLEWKNAAGALRTAQALLFKRITMDGRSTVFVVEGNAETMSVSRFCIYWQGRQFRWRPSDIDGLKYGIQRWVARQEEARQADARNKFWATHSDRR